jgi:hypothetical protein
MAYPIGNDPDPTQSRARAGIILEPHRSHEGTDTDRAAKLRARTIIISGYIFSLPTGAADRHGLLTKPISIFNLVAAVQHR